MGLVWLTAEPVIHIHQYDDHVQSKTRSRTKQKGLATNNMVGVYDEDPFPVPVCLPVCMLCTVCRWYLYEGTHQHCQQLGLHKNDRQAELLQEM